MVCIMMGLMLFVYCIVMDIDMWVLDPMSCPLFYMVLGLVVFVCRMFFDEDDLLKL